jgi:3-oxoacyl-[acyl-carrier-protein] synthase-3
VTARDPGVWLAGAAYELGEHRIPHDRIDGLRALFEARQLPLMPAILGLGDVYRTDDVYRLASASIGKTLAKAGLAGAQVDCVIASAASFRHEFDAQKIGYGGALHDHAIQPRAFYAVCGTGCVAVLSAIELARDLVGCQRFGCVLIVNVDHIASTDDRARFIDYAMVSDSAASVVVVGQPEPAARHRVVALSTRTDVEQMRHGIRWNSADIGTQTIACALQTAQIQLADLDKVLATNMFLPIKKHRERALGVAPGQQFLANLPRFGHCLAADALIGLVDCETAEPRLRMMYSEADGHAAALIVHG